MPHKRQTENDRIIHIKNTYTGKRPMTYHETGCPLKRDIKGIPNYLPELTNQIIKMPKRDIGIPSDLTIVTWNNYTSESILEKTCKHLGIPLQVHGKDLTDWCTNFKCKINLMYESCLKANTKYVLGLDSRDLIMVATPHQILEKFKKMKAKMLFGGTIKTSNFYKGADDLLKFMAELPKARRSIFRNLNGGQWIAEKEFALELFKKALEYPPRIEKPESDQIVLTHALCYNPELSKKTKIDYKCEIFQIRTEVVPILFNYKRKDSFFYDLYLKLASRITFMEYILERKKMKFLKNLLRLVGVNSKLYRMPL